MKAHQPLIQKAKIVEVNGQHLAAFLKNSKFKNIFVFCKNEIWLKNGTAKPSLHSLQKTQLKNIKISSAVQVGHSGFISVLDPLPGFYKVNVRNLLDILPKKIFYDFMLGVQLAQWSEGYQFCAGCSKALKPSKHELAKHCSNCERSYYPHLHPAIIVVIYKKDKTGKKLLLAKGPAPRKFYGCIAGYVEAGESAEECLHREVFEEVGIKVKNIQYFSSQPWPFPSQLMLGYIAEWQSGKIKIAPEELTDAQWFSPKSLPLLPPKMSIARQLIERVANEK